MAVALSGKLGVEGGHSLGGVQLRGGGAGGHRVAADAGAGELNGHVLRHGNDGGLRGGVGDTGVAAHAADGGDVDDGAAVGLFHVGQDFLHHIVHAVLIHLNDVIPPVVLDAGDGAVLVGDAGVVDQHVDLAEGVDGLLDDLLAVLIDAHVGGDGDDLHALGGALGLHFLQLVQAAGDQNQIAALIGEDLGGALADAGVGAGDDGNFTFQTIHKKHPFYSTRWSLYQYYRIIITELAQRGNNYLPALL